MSEPIMWRTRFGRAVAALNGPSSDRLPTLRRIISLCCVCSLLSLAAAPVHAQSAGNPVRYAIESQKATSNLLLDIVHAGQRLVAAGDRGHVLFSDDDGFTWTQAKVPTRQLLTAIHFVDDKHGWAVGHDALILATTDGGETWTRQYEDREGEVPLLDIWFENAQHGIAVGAYGVMLETTDGGQNWQDIAERLDNADGFHLNAISPIGEYGLFIVGEMGGMFRSGDRGQSWERVESPYEGSFFGVLGGNQPEVVIAFGLRGHLFRSADFGDSWEQIELTDNNRVLRSGLSGGALLADSRLVVVGHAGVVLTSDDQGKTFNVLHRNDRRSLANATSNGQGKLVLVGQSGIRIAEPSGAEPSQE